MNRTMLVRDFLSFLRVLAEEKSLKREARRIVEGTIRNLEAEVGK